MGDTARKGSDLFHSTRMLHAPVKTDTLLLNRPAVDRVDQYVQQHPQQDKFSGFEKRAFLRHYLKAKRDQSPVAINARCARPSADAECLQKRLAAPCGQTAHLPDADRTVFTVSHLYCKFRSRFRPARWKGRVRPLPEVWIRGRSRHHEVSPMTADMTCEFHYGALDQCVAGIW